jgi:hypothetical protein
MSWAKLTGNAWIFHDISPASFPDDFWGQVDVWIPPETFTACDDNVLFGVTAEFLDFGNDALHARLFSGVWKWETDEGTVATTGPAASTTYTIKFHYVKGGSTAVVDWYVNGVLVATDTGVNAFSQHDLFLNNQPEGCCCEIYYYTNVKIGTSDGGTDIFASDFSEGLGFWTRNTPVFQPSGLAVVDATSTAACPTFTISPPRGLPGDTITFTGTGFAPDSPLSLFFDTHQVAITESSDGSGGVSFGLPVPHIPASGIFEGYDVYLLDGDGNVACSEAFAAGGFDVCGATPADGISTDPDPLIATGGLTNNSNAILDYIFHDGAHWVLWQDTSQVSGLNGTFPPPANHTMNATRISADGASVVDYPIDSNYHWDFGSGAVSDPGLASGVCTGGHRTSAPVWDSKFFFSSWSKPINDAHFASDGTTLWVALLTAETVPYPWLDNSDAIGLNPGSASQFVPLATLTSGFTSFATSTGTGYHRYNTQTTGPIDFFQPHSFPVTDAGEADSGYWTPPVVVLYSFDGAGFNRIGEIDAKYAPGQTGGVGYGTSGSIIGEPGLSQKAQRGTLISRVSICADPNDPGRCHVVWSEGGDWGRQGLANGFDCSRLVWDSGPQNKSYRVNYTTWSPTAKLTDTDIFSSHFDRTNGFFLYEGFDVGLTWPDAADFAGILEHDLRNDNAAGTPYLFAVLPQIFVNPFNEVDDPGPWLDQYPVFGDTLHVYDLSSGGAVEVQALDLSTLGMTNDELNEIYVVGSPYANPVGPVDAVLDAYTVSATVNLGPIPKGFGLSLPYDDPDLGVPVYLVHIPLVKRFVPQATSPDPTIGTAFASRGFYRIPCDMSTTFDYLDGDRLIGFTILKEPITGFFAQTFGSQDFFSDPKNVWMPPWDGFGSGFNGFTGWWFDRICFNTWTPMNNSPPLLPPDPANYWLGSQCPGFLYDPAADSITTVTAASVDETDGGPLFAVTTLFLCRGCRNCKCGTGVHITRRF